METSRYGGRVKSAYVVFALLFWVAVGIANQKSAEALIDESTAALDSGDLEKASDLSEAAAAQARSEGRVDLEVEALVRKLTTLVWQSRISDAVALAESVLVTAKASEQPLVIARARAAYGSVQTDAGDATKAETNLRAAAEVFRAAGQAEKLAAVYRRLGAVSHELRGDYAEAERWQKLAVEQYRNAGAELEVARTQINIANSLTEQRRFTEALAVQQQALTTLRTANDRVAALYSWSGVAQLLVYVGRYEEALRETDGVVAEANDLGFTQFIAAGQLIRSQVLIGLKRSEEAESALDEAFSASAEDINYQVAIALNMVVTAANNGHFEKAERFLEILRHSPAVRGNVWQEGAVRTAAGGLEYQRGQLDRAYRSFSESIPYVYAGTDPYNQLLSLQGLCQSSEAVPRHAALLCKLLINYRAWTLHEGAQLERSERQTLIEVDRKDYEVLLKALVELGRLEEAERVIAMLRQDEYGAEAELTGDHILKVGYTPNERTWIERFDTFAARAEAIGPGDNATEQAAKLVPEAVELFEHIQDAMQAAPAPSAPATSDSVLGDGIASLAYFVGETSLVTVLSVDGSRHALIQDVPAEDIEALSARFRAGIQDPERPVANVAQELYDLIIRPHRELIDKPEIKTLAISGDGPLRYVPFAALNDGKSWLVERFSVFSYGPATGIQDGLSSSWKQSQVYALGTDEGGFGLPPLPSVESELENIAKTSFWDFDGVFDGRIAFRKDFTLAPIEGASSEGFNILHIASHFVLSPTGAADSFLMLGAGNRVSLAELAKSRFDLSGIDLVTLSACSTAVDLRTAYGREIDGMSRLMKGRGAKAVLATLWPAADDTASILVTDFYRTLASATQMSLAEALREAQIAMIHGEAPTRATRDAASRGREIITRGGIGVSGKSTHPYFWAPFVLAQ